MNRKMPCYLATSLLLEAKIKEVSVSSIMKSLTKTQSCKVGQTGELSFILRVVVSQ